MSDTPRDSETPAPGRTDGKAHSGAKAPLPRLIAWELTRRCVLACRHCRASASTESCGAGGPAGGGDASPGELSTAQVEAGLRSVAACAKPIIILTGGEPLLRGDVYELAAVGTSLGLRMVLATCGTLLDEPTCRRLIASGVRRVSVSLDGADAAGHDAFRGQEGAFAATLAGLEAARRAGLEFQVNSTLCRSNLSQLPALLELAARLGAKAFNPFMLVPTGRGSALVDQELSAEQYEQALEWLADHQGRPDIAIRVTCAPRYQRIIRRKHLAAESARGGRGCMAGESFAFVSHDGKVQPCGFLPIECGDLRAEGMDFARVWEQSTVLAELRDLSRLKGRCGACEYVRVCGGCRARALARGGDYLAPEPFCTHKPLVPREDAPSPQTPSSGRPGGDGAKSGGDEAGNDADVSSSKGLDEIDRRLLTAVQAELPVAHRPFEVLAGRLGAPADRLLAKLGAMKRRGLVRRVGGVFDAARLGFASTLVASAVPADRLERVAGIVSRRPEVTHCYQRDHEWNLWFTFTAPSADDLQAHLAELAMEAGADLWSLPAVKTYKISAQFPVAESPGQATQDSRGQACPPYATGHVAQRTRRAPRAPAGQTPLARGTNGAAHEHMAQPPSAVHLDAAQRDLARLMQDDLPLCEQPYAALADRLGRPAGWVLEQLHQWLATGVLRRVSALARHQRIGYAANAMVAFCVPAEQIDAAGAVLARREDVTHCYHRQAPGQVAGDSRGQACPPYACAPDWPYNLFAMFHAADADRLAEAIRQAARDAELSDYVVLKSVREFKKTSMVYF